MRSLTHTSHIAPASFAEPLLPLPPLLKPPLNLSTHSHTRATASRPSSAASSMILEGALRPNRLLEEEAERFVSERLQRRVLAVHWRHGDYVAYKLLTPLASLVDRVKNALRAAQCTEREAGAAAAAEAEGGGDAAGAVGGSTSGDHRGGEACVIFLMTNCHNGSALIELSAALSPTRVISYQPPSPWHAHEGRRLVTEQAIAARAHAFVSSPRSAVSEYVETMRRGRRKEASKLVTAKLREEQRAKASKRTDSNRMEL